MQNKHLLSHVKPGGRTFSVLVTLLVTAMTLLPQSVCGQTTYELTVAGVQVTSDNAANITGQYLSEGTAVFDASSNTLTLSNVKIGYGGVQSGLENLTIVFNGTNIIESYIGANTAVAGSHNLTLQSGSEGSTMYLANTVGKSIIDGFDNISMDGLYVSSNDTPFAYDETAKQFKGVQISGVILQTATITSIPHYSLWVGNTQLNVENKDDVFPNDQSLAGKVSFDNSSKILSLQNVDLPYNVFSALNNLTIDVSGNCKVGSGDSATAVRNVHSSSTLTLKSTGTGNQLSFSNNRPIRDFSSITLTGLYWDDDYTYGPVTFEDWDGEKQAVVELVGMHLLKSDGSEAAGAIATSAIPYQLKVAGTKVTSENAADILVSLGQDYTGMASFNASTNTLTLNGATIRGTTISNGCIVSGLSSLNIVLKGYNTLDCSQDSCTAIRSVANAALTITKGEDECSLGFYGSRAIRDFKSVTLSGMVWDRTCAYQLATINNNGEHTGMMLYDTVGDEIGEINILDAENLPHPSMYSHYDPEQTATLFGFEADPSWEIRYSIDYVDESLEDVTNALYDMQQDENGVPLQGAATVTAWTVFGNATSDVVKGKLFELSETSLYTVNGAAPLSAPILRPAIEPEDGISVSYTGTEQSDVATIDPTTGEVTILGLGNESFSVNIDIEQENGCTVLNEESLPFEVNVLNSYPLYIGDTQVTEINAEDVLGDGTVSFMKSEGQVAATTYTLTLNGAAITGPVKVGLSNLTFDIQGTNTITTDGTCIQNVVGSESMPSLTFMSSADVVGSLTLTNTDEEGTNGVISDSYYGHFTISEELALILYRYGFYTSYTDYFSAGEVHNAQLVPSYGVQVDDLQVYAGNAADVFGDGTVSFDKEKSILTLNGANTGALCSSLTELTVELIGNNTLSAGGSYPVLRSLSGDAVTINVQSTAAVKGTLTMNMPYTQAGNFCEDQVTLNIVAPLEVVSGSLTGNDDNNNTVVIGPNYGITITSAGGSYPITSDNRTNVLGDQGAEPTVQFDGKNTLFLNNAHLNGEIIVNSSAFVEEPLIIHLKGTNTINNETYLVQNALATANIKVKFATGELAPGSLTYTTQMSLKEPISAFVGCSVTYVNGLAPTLSEGANSGSVLSISMSLQPIVNHSGEEKTLDGEGDGLGEDIENKTTDELTAGVVVNGILYTLPDANDGYESPGESGSGKVVAINSTMTEEEINTIAGQVANGTQVPGTPEFAVKFKGVTFLLPAGAGKIIVNVRTNESGKLAVKIGEQSAVTFEKAKTAFEELVVPFACSEPTFVLLCHDGGGTDSREMDSRRAPGRKETATVEIKGLSVSASSVVAVPEPALSPVLLDKSAVAKVAGKHFIKVNNPDVAGVDADAFEGVKTDDELTYVDLTKTGIKGITVDRSTDAFKNVPEKAFIYLPAGNKVKTGTKNVIIGSVCEDMVMEEAPYFEMAQDFTARNVKQNRDYSKFVGKNCTVYLPFAIDAETAASLGTFYELKGYDGTTVSMESVTETKANTPYMFKPKAADTKVAAKMVTVEATPAAAPVAGNMKFVGTYEQKDIVSNTSTQYYCFMAADGEMAGKFVHVTTNAVTMNPYRAYMVVEGGASSRELDLVIDGVSTGIKNMKVGTDDNVYYDLQGRRVLYPTKGLYIVNGRKVIIK